MRHPFPGPGLSVRIIGEVTPTKLQICKIASKIVEDELIEAGVYEKVWQAYAAVGDDRAVGVVGDERRYGNIVMIRVVDSIDAMTADWTRLPHGLLEKISNRITNEIEDVWVEKIQQTTSNNRASIVTICDEILDCDSENQLCWNL